ncbi:MAG: nucleotidyltransferase family protein [Pseudomonadota bacterium]
MNVIVLAGDRGPDDPLARQAGVTGKTLVPVAGLAMLTRVLQTLGAWQRLDRAVVVAPDKPEYLSAISAAGIGAATLLAPEASPSQSVAAALKKLGPQRPVTLVTADHPLLRIEWLEQLDAAAEDQDDLRVGLVDHAGVRSRFPDSRRTRYRFSDRELGGTNLFQFRTVNADRILTLWRQVESERKRPWKIVSLLGAANLLRYAAGRLHSKQAFAALSQRLGVRVGYRLIDDPLSAVDVDTPADLALVEALFKSDQVACG